MNFYTSISATTLLLAFLQLTAAQNLRSTTATEHRELWWNKNYVDLSCEPDEAVECGLWKNETGVLACHELGGWFPWSKPSKHTICIPQDKAQDGDTCGCCEEPCPVKCVCPCSDEVDNGDVITGGVYLNYTRTGKLRCVSEVDSMTAQLLGVYECAQC